MPGLFFINSLMLAGLAGLGIPVLIHLLLRRRKKKLVFSTIRFFQQQDEQSSRRRKLRNWLLLAMRLLIVALLVLAFARPFSRQNQASGTARKQRRVVFVIDSSARMLANGTAGQRWAQAKSQMQKELSAMQPGDLVVLIECGSHANVLAGFAPPAAAARTLQDLAPALGTSTLSDGLQQAVRLLSGSPAGSDSALYLVTDLQKSACRGLSSSPVPQAIDFRIMSVGDVSSPNLAISKLDTQGHDGTLPQASVVSFSDEDAVGRVQFAADGATFLDQPLTLKAGASTNIAVPLPALKPGWHSVMAQVKVRDSMELDNTRYAAFVVPEPARVLIAEPRIGARSFEQATFFLSAALDPTKDSTNALPGPFHLQQVSPEQIPGALDSTNGSSSWNVVVIPGLKSLPPGSGSRLARFVRDGGGLVLFLSDDVSANHYNSELGDLLPARIGALEQSPDINTPWRIAFVDTNSTVFSAFRTPNSGDLRIPEFNQRYSLQPADGASRFCFFDDGTPLVIAKNIGKGRVVLVNTSPDTAWTDWAKHKTFVPFVHSLARFAAQNSTHEEPGQMIACSAGDDLELQINQQADGSEFVLKRPDAKEVKIAADKQGRVRDPGVAMPGIYSLRNKVGKEILRVAVNIPEQESNLDAIRPNDFTQQLVRNQDSQKQTLASGLFGAKKDQREFWTALLLGALVLLLVEPFIANRTS